MEDDIERRLIKMRVDDTRCPDTIRELGITAEHVYLLRERIDCGDWRHVKEYFTTVPGKWIVTQPPPARKYLTLEPDKVIEAMRKQGLW